MGIDIVDDGVAALEAVHKKHYDIVFMDIEMPNMDEVCSSGDGGDDY